MKYMFLIYADESRTLSAEESAAMRSIHTGLMNEATAKGILVRAEPLKSTRFATTVHKQNGKRIVTDGPFAESKEQFVGYYILDLNSMDEALEWAARIPAGPAGDECAIEIRPVSSLPPITSV